MCEYCREKEREYLIDYDGFKVLLDDLGDGEYLYIEVPVKVGKQTMRASTQWRANYCPECGRKLGDEL